MTKSRSTSVRIWIIAATAAVMTMIAKASAAAVVMPPVQAPQYLILPKAQAQVEISNKPEISPEVCRLQKKITNDLNKLSRSAPLMADINAQITSTIGNYENEAGRMAQTCSFIGLFSIGLLISSLSFLLLRHWMRAHLSRSSRLFVSLVVASMALQFVGLKLKDHLRQAELSGKLLNWSMTTAQVRPSGNLKGLFEIQRRMFQIPTAYHAATTQKNDNSDLWSFGWDQVRQIELERKATHSIAAGYGALDHEVRTLKPFWHPVCE